MTEQRVKFPIRFKLILTLTVIPLVTLSLYLALAVDLFKKDKIAYVLDSSVTTTRAIAAQVHSNIGSILSSMQPIFEGFDLNETKFDHISQSLFQKESRFSMIVVFDLSSSTMPKKSAFLQKSVAADAYLTSYRAYVEQILTRINQENLLILPIDNGSNDILVGVKHHVQSAQKHWVFISVVQDTTLFEIFHQSDIYTKYLFGPNGETLMGPKDRDVNLTSIVAQEFGSFKGEYSNEGTKEVRTSKGSEFLASYAKVGVGELTVTSFVERGAALAAVQSLLIKSILFFVALISATVIVSVFASQKMTSALRQLYLATKKISHGDFDIKVLATSKDEVGSLAQGFNKMAVEVSRLMSETAEKARMENELKTAQVVQENLLPPPSSDLGAVHISGFFEPASEIGGDWWHYSEIGDRIFFWIGDATGHGAPAALITSAAKSASAIVECFPDITPAKALFLMNRAIYETSKSRFMMTFFLGAIDKQTGVLTYSNASHDPPYLLRASDEPLKKKDIVLLNEVNNPRLGQQRDVNFLETTINLCEGDSIALYTDGVLDLQNKSGESWGERRFIKSLLGAVSAKGNSTTVVETVKNEAFAFREDAPLNDDFTIFLCRFEGLEKAS